MDTFRQIFTLGTMSVLVSVCVTGCPSGQKPYETSQQILIETATALRDVDQAVADIMRAQEDAAIERAVNRVEMGECDEGEDRQECVVRFLRIERENWYRLVEVLESIRELLAVWERANDAWQESGERPPDWDERICRPVGEGVDAVLEGLEAVSVNVPQSWRAVITKADDLCSLGVAVAEAVTDNSETHAVE
jgi:hypothetical protein